MAEKRTAEPVGAEAKRARVGVDEEPAVVGEFDDTAERFSVFNSRDHYNPDRYGASKGINPDGPRGQIIDGKKIAGEMRASLKQTLDRLMTEEKDVYSRKPCLVVIIVGSNPASKVYVGQKEKACKEVGIESRRLNMDAETKLSELLAKVDELNADATVDGILVQLPLPTRELQDGVQQVIERINPGKDVDGFHPYNLGCLASRCPKLRPCTPIGVMQLLWSTGVNPYGLECLVVGASNHVGRPMMLELLLAGASVQLVHRWSRDLEAHVRRAECIVVAAGKPGLVKGEWIRPGAIVLDIGINRLESGKLVGDVDFEEAKKNASWITPVPGGVGPMTVANLLSNTLEAYDRHVRP